MEGAPCLLSERFLLETRRANNLQTFIRIIALLIFSLWSLPSTINGLHYVTIALRLARFCAQQSSSHPSANRRCQDFGSTSTSLHFIAFRASKRF